MARNEVASAAASAAAAAGGGGGTSTAAGSVVAAERIGVNTEAARAADVQTQSLTAPLVRTRVKEETTRMSVDYHHRAVSGERSARFAQPSALLRGAPGVPIIRNPTYHGRCRVPHQIGAPVGSPPPVPRGAPVGPIVPMAPFTARQLGQSRPASFVTVTPAAMTVGG